MGRVRRALTGRPIAYHPLLFAAFPVLFLYAANVNQGLVPADLAVPLSVVVGVTAAALAVAALVFADLRRAAIVVSAWVLLSLSYGHAWGAVRGGGDAVALREDLLLGLWALLAVGAVSLAVLLRRRLGSATRALNLVAAFLVVVNVAQIAASAVTGAGGTEAKAGPIGLQMPENPRDVYYIVMDRYGRAETLAERFEVDNEPFLDSLRRRGFIVAAESVANYPKTAHSLAASLNMTYLDDLASDPGPESGDWGPVYRMLQSPAVSRALQDIGYRYVYLGSRWEPTRTDPSADRNVEYGRLSEFSQVLYDTTILPTLVRRLDLEENLDPRERERRRILHQFEELQALRRDDEPTFAFAHILLPHEPYLFHADGSPVAEAEEAARTVEESYADQLAFANRKLDQLLNGLFTGPSETWPIVIVQADEGPHPERYEHDQVDYRWDQAPVEDLREKMWILNAYHLPGRGPEPYPQMSPVNTFRLVLNRYFGADLPLLPDRSFVFRDLGHPYDYTEVTGKLRVDEG